MTAYDDPATQPAVLTRRTALQLAMALAAGSAVPGVVAASASSASVALDFAATDALAMALVAEKVIPGLSLAVMRGGEILHARGFGSANLETGTPVTAETVFRVGSVSKQFIAVSLALLAEDGSLSLDDPLSRFLPLFPRAKDVTLRQMIHHTSGLGNYTETQPREEFFKHARLDYGDAELLAAMANTSPLFKFEPGTGWAYSNTAYLLLGLVVQVVTGEPYGVFMQKRLFTPAGLVRTAVDDAGDVVTDRASGYTAKPDRPGEIRNADFISMTFPGAAGAMRSTASDLCRWHAALLGGRILQPSTLRDMLTPARLANGDLPPTPPRPDLSAEELKKPIRYGYGVFLGDFEGHEYVEHDGGIFGFVALHRSFWPQQATVAVLVNYDGFDSPEKFGRLKAVRDSAVRTVLAT